MFEHQGAYIALKTFSGTLDDALTLHEVARQMVASGANSVGLIYEIGRMTSPSSNLVPMLAQQEIPQMELLAASLQSSGLEIMVQLMLYLDYETGVIGGADEVRPEPADPQAWFASFREGVLRGCDVAVAIGASSVRVIDDWIAPILASHPSLTDDMVALIGEIRSTYGLQVSGMFWTPANHDNQLTATAPQIIDALDFIGLGFFPRFTEENDPTLAELIAAWFDNPHTDQWPFSESNLLDYLESVHAAYGKDIFIADRTFHSFDGANRDESQVFAAPIERLDLDYQEQVDLYQAFFAAITSRNWPWFMGVHFGSYSTNPLNPDPGAFHLGIRGETVNLKPAEVVLGLYLRGEMVGFVGAASDYLVGVSAQGPIVQPVAVDEVAKDLDAARWLQFSDTLWRVHAFAAGGENATRQQLSSGDAAAPATTRISVWIDGEMALGVLPSYTVTIDGVQWGGTYVAADVTDPFRGPDLVIDLPAGTSPSSIAFATTNWVFQNGENRFFSVQRVEVDGRPSDRAAASYVTHSGFQSEFTGAGKTATVHGGTVTFDLTALPEYPKDSFVLDPGGFVLVGSPGFDTFDAQDELLSVAYPQQGGARFSGAAGEYLVHGVERVLFGNEAYAFDLDGHAGLVARLVGTLFGPAYLESREIVGIGLDLLDAGMPLAQLAELAAGTALFAAVAGSGSTEAFVRQVYANVFGTEPSDAEVVAYSGLLDNGTFTRGTLGALAAGTELVAQRIDLAGLAVSGLEYI
jgi:hypothetical protein